MPHESALQVGASNIRRNMSAEAKGQTEKLIRDAHGMLSGWGVPKSPSWVTKTVRRYQRDVSGFTFFDYLANAVQVSAMVREESRAEIDAWLRASYAADPTGVTAVRNVDRERGGRVA